jgi:DNA-binding XRE family transcriptional regulator
MKGLRSIPRILKINQIDSYRVSVLFNNGESRIIDFKHLFEEVFKVQAPDPAAKLLADYELFKQIQIIEHSVGWPGVGIHSKNEKGETVFYHYDLDPLVLYQNSEPDEERNLVIGLMIKQARKEAGMTQQELAERSGTSKHYISRLENNKSDIELLTLKKIVEAGLGKKLKVQIS